jgi:ferritin-like metal-binding protein YciE
MNTKQFEELVLQSLEHELGGVKIYTTALGCALDDDLKQEWQKYLEQTKTHVRALEDVCVALGVEADKETPGRSVVRLVGGALVEAMKQAQATADPANAQIVACEAVVLAETKDHANWQLLQRATSQLPGEAAAALLAATTIIEDQEDEHLYHGKGWCRELWLQSLGFPAVLPPMEEQRHVKTAIGAARAEQAAELLRLQSEPT